MTGLAYTSATQRQVWRVVPDLIKARQLLRDLVWKDLRARYRYAVMGFLWAVLEPLAFTLVLTFVFTFIFRARIAVGSDAAGPHFAAVLLCGLIFWQFMTTALNSATLSLVENQNLVKKVYFARETIPLAAVTFPLVNLGIGFILLLVVHVALGGRLSPALMWFLPVFGLQFALAAGLGLLLSCGHVHFRDVGNMVNVGLLFGFYASPVFYPIEFLRGAVERGSVPAWTLTVYMLNPMAGLLTAYRQILFEARRPDLLLVVWPGVLAVLAVLVGVVVFRKTAPTLSDHL